MYVRKANEHCDEQHQQQRLIFFPLMRQQHEQYSSFLLSFSFDNGCEFSLYIDSESLKTIELPFEKDFLICWCRAELVGVFKHRGMSGTKANRRNWGGRQTVVARKAIFTWIYNDADT